MKRIVFFMVALLSEILTAVAQHAVLNGLVTEKLNNGKIVPVSHAVIYRQGADKFVLSDSSGVFRLTSDVPIRFIIIQATGYFHDTINVAGRDYVNVMLKSNGTLQDVVITYTRKSTEVSFIDPWKTTIMNEKELYKAACCNLAESFETNPGVDVAYTDALTGTRQIQMLGLAGQYNQMSEEQLPSIRGISSNFGLAYTPGTWINSIQVTKGMGSVVNGFESVSGGINVELHKSSSKDRLLFNTYASSGNRYEANLVAASPITDNISNALFLHASTVTMSMDRNGDGFKDNPVGNQYNGLYRLSYDSKKGFVFHSGIQWLSDIKTGGELAFREMHMDTSGKMMYGTQVKANRVAGFAKIGYVFPDARYKSIGLQFTSSRQEFDNFFGHNTYSGKQITYTANLIYQSMLGSPSHKFRTGISFLGDGVKENLFNVSDYVFKRNELVGGGYFEYTYTKGARFTAVSGVRLDYNNLFGWFFIPRLHLRYAPSDNMVIRASAGSGWRTPSLISDNMGLLASSRQLKFDVADYSRGAYGFRPEKAWNFGMSVTRDFKLNYRNGTASLDYYYTFFTNQVVVDRDQNPQEIHYYNLQGNSFSRSFQAQVDYQPVRRFDVRLAYRWFDVKMQYNSGLLSVPLISPHRGFLNLAYQTRSKFTFDFTLNANGKKRIPETWKNPIEYQLPSFSRAYSVVNVQVGKSFKKQLDVYTGIENLFNFKQHNPILSAGDPFGSWFDAGMIWGPVFGRMVYAGLRWRI